MQLCRTCKWAEKYEGAFGWTWACNYNGQHKHPTHQLRNYYGGNTGNEECFQYRVRHGLREDIERMRANMSKKFSSETRERIAKLKMEGRTPKEIAEAVGLEPLQVSQFVYNHKDFIQQYADLHQTAEETPAEQEAPAEEVVVTKNETTICEPAPAVEETAEPADDELTEDEPATDLEETASEEAPDEPAEPEVKQATATAWTKNTDRYVTVREEDYNALLAKVGQTVELHHKVESLERRNGNQCNTIKEMELKLADAQKACNAYAAEIAALKEERLRATDQSEKISELQAALAMTDAPGLKAENEHLRNIIIKMLLNASGKNSVEDALISIVAEKLGVA